MGSDGNCKYLPMFSLFYVKYVNRPMLIIVLCLVLLEACVPLFVFNYTVAVLHGSLLFCIGSCIVVFVNIVIKHYCICSHNSVNRNYFYTSHT